MPSHSLKWRKSNEIACARRTTSREGVDIETRPFSFTPRGKCTWAASHDSFLAIRENRPDYCPSATCGCEVSAQRESLFFYPFLGTITRAASICDLTYDVAYCGSFYVQRPCSFSSWLVSIGAIGFTLFITLLVCILRTLSANNVQNSYWRS